MEINFCEGCDNIMFIYSDETQKNLFLGCKNCGTKEDYSSDKSIYTNTFKFDFSETINNNKYLSYDNTLPVIEGNKNIKCPNEKCISNSGDFDVVNREIIYIRYDHINMKYMYLCSHCDFTWNTEK